ncbi:precorrin-2 dehydrogenase/sirohydrochlorin ferrochelatase family protein, partial [Brevundimonas abyssalis]
MRVFLASIPLTDVRVAVIGGGEAALAKLRLFTTSPAALSWFAVGEVADRREWPNGAPEPVFTEPTAEHLAGARLVFIAVENAGDAARLAAMARTTGAQVNVVDRPHLSDFQTPALIDRDQVVVGVATGGLGPILARDLRSRIEAVLPAALGPLARLAGELRETVKASVPDFMARRRFWERAFRGPAADLVAHGREAEARREMLRLLNVAAP